MSGLQLNSITGPGTAAATSVASALVPKRNASLAPGKAMATSGAAGAKDTSPADSSTGDISSTDFLSLLVSELKNQDPTQPTDPNAYITQLVGVNSLQQLIQINSGLTSIETPSTGTTGN
jgi:flagellar basal-body rod modification protein FlgD